MRLLDDEIYYLNRALDGEKIFGVNPKLKTLMLDDKEVEKNLKDKALLDENNKINKAACKIIRRIEQYKNCDRHIIIDDNIIIAPYEGKKIIVLKKEDEQTFHLDKTLLEFVVVNIISKHNFLLGEIEEDNDDCDIPTIINDYEDKISIEEVNSNFENKKIIFYYKNKKVYKYNVLNENIEKMNGVKARKEIVSLLEHK